MYTGYGVRVCVCTQGMGLEFVCVHRVWGQSVCVCTQGVGLEFVCVHRVWG